MIKQPPAALCLSLALAFFASRAHHASAEDAARPPGLDGLRQTMKEGNFREAYEGLRRLALDRRTDRRQVPEALSEGIVCLTRLGRVAEIDVFREEVIARHAENVRVLWRAAQTYLSVDHHGFLIAGTFRRGPHRGGGRHVNALARDRVRALQLMQQAMPAVAKQLAPREASDFYLSLADMVLSGRQGRLAWRLQVLTDLSRLPDYDTASYGAWGPSLGAPVDPQGRPILYTVPSSWQAAASDGQRWRYALARAVDAAPARRYEVLLRRARFLEEQFGVATLAEFGPLLARMADRPRGEGEVAGTYALHTLSDEETIAKLAIGIRRFTLPDPFNPIKLYQRIVAEDTTSVGGEASVRLARIFENRRQYSRAADAWKSSIERYGKTPDKQEHLEQIERPWGRFEPVMTQGARTGATVDFRFRNGRQVAFTAHRIRLRQLLDDAKAYLQSSPRKLSWHALQLENLGYRLVTRNEKKYLGPEVARWQLDLQPRPHHWDRRITVATPLRDPGVYLLTATMAEGNTSKIVLWVSDTAIVKKRMAGKIFFYLSDAVTGAPIPGATIERFGYRIVRHGKNQFHVETRRRAARTDQHGQVEWELDKKSTDYQWLTLATTAKGRLAFLGFSHVWRANRPVQRYDQTKVFCVTDRPIYRPGQTVHFKLWVRRARYGGDLKDALAHQAFWVVVFDAKGKKIDRREMVSDAYGGVEGHLELPADASLGVYRVLIEGRGGGTFRVEEYKKPEFEVTVDRPERPVALGEKVTAVVRARYYFGAPVAEARVKVKVLRTGHDDTWYPPAPWDWLYGTGYWWFAGDYTWYPNWRHWGCVQPRPSWGWYPHAPPEVVAQFETDIRPDGTVPVTIDTALAKLLHGDQDHRYQIVAEVVDRSRRTVVGGGSILVSRKPVQVVVWTDRGYYRVGDVIHASVAARTPDGKPLAGKGRAELLKITYDKDQKPVETSVGQWEVATDRRGEGRLRIQASRQGQYRLAYHWTDEKGRTFDAGYLLTIVGDTFDGSDFQFSDLELIPDRREYAPGDTVHLQINTNRVGATVLLFVRPVGGIYPAPRQITLKGKSTVVDIGVKREDMPNFFLEAVTVARGRVFTVIREMHVPPEQRVLGVEVVPSSTTFLPGGKAEIKLKLTDADGKPVVGSTVLAVYDKALEYISGGSNVPAIREFYWKWRRTHHSDTATNLGRYATNLAPPGKRVMENIGLFGGGVADEVPERGRADIEQKQRLLRSRAGVAAVRRPAGMPVPLAAVAEAAGDQGGRQQETPATPWVEATVRTDLADTALWKGSLTTDENGMARVTFDMPENLTTWKVRVWAMAEGTRVGEATTEIVTRKDLIVRLQAPRFFVERDEAVLSANVHNYLPEAKQVRVALELDGDAIQPIDRTPRTVHVEKDGEARVDWRVRAVAEGRAVIRVIAQTDTESDALQMSYPVYVHGMVKTEAFSGALRADQARAAIDIRVPRQRRAEASRLELRFSPTLAGAMVDALPYLVDYPYGCTEQTLNRFLPTVITQKVLIDMGIDLEAIREKRTNLNPQEIGDDAERARQWKRWARNPVFDSDEVRKMVRKGVEALSDMQLSDGGWGWFSGWGERSHPHTTALVVHGLQVAAQNDVALLPGVLDRGVVWLGNYQQQQLERLQNAPARRRPFKLHADNTDAMVAMVLADAGAGSQEMLDYLYRDRTRLSAYGQALLGMALHRRGDRQRLAMVVRNIGQLLVEDPENQTAYLNLTGPYWWWYGSDIETHAYYLKLLVATDPRSPIAPKIVKYLVNNRRHATYWNATRDTAVVIEAMADYLRATGEGKPRMVVEIWMDGQRRKQVEITAENLFAFDNRWVLEGRAVEAGDHRIEIRRRGRGPLYYNAYLTHFTLEDPIDPAGLELKITRKLYRLQPVDATAQVAGSRGQAVATRVEKYRRIELTNLSSVDSGALVEVELTVESKNDYEYIVLEDRKAAGFEAVDVRSGYNGNALGAYVEYRDHRVVLFVRRLARGRHSVAYRLRAEVPGRFCALPARAAAMYAPELVGNSGEVKLIVDDK